MAVYANKHFFKLRSLYKMLLAQGNCYPNVIVFPIMYITFLHLKFYPTKLNIPSPVTEFVQKI